MRKCTKSDKESLLTVYAEIRLKLAARPTGLLEQFNCFISKFIKRTGEDLSDHEMTKEEKD